MITYNHEKYIDKAIESVLNQVTSYSYELVIAEDFSSDKTREIICKYRDLNPNKIKLVLQNKNVGALKNHHDLLANLSGRYIAVLDGDDHWTDNGKLQEQVDFLESNTDFSLCFTNVKLIDGAGKTINDALLKYETDVFTHDDFVAKISPPTLTIMYRKEALPEILPPVFYKVNNGDMFMKALISQHGKVKYINKVTANYCQHEGGISSGISAAKRLEFKLNTLNIMLKYFKSAKVKSNIKDAMNITYVKLLFIYFSKKNFSLFFKTMFTTFGFYIFKLQFPPVRFFIFQLKNKFN